MYPQQSTATTFPRISEPSNKSLGWVWHVALSGTLSLGNCRPRGAVSMAGGQSCFSVSPLVSSRQQSPASSFSRHLQAHLSTSLGMMYMGIYPFFSGVSFGLSHPESSAVWLFPFVKSSRSSWAPIAGVEKVRILLPVFPLFGCRLSSWHSPGGQGEPHLVGSWDKSAPRWNVLSDCGLTHNIYAILCFTLGEYAVILVNYTICQE